MMSVSDAIKHGYLTVDQPFACGIVWGKYRALFAFSIILNPINDTWSWKPFRWKTEGTILYDKAPWVNSRCLFECHPLINETHSKKLRKSMSNSAVGMPMFWYCEMLDHLQPQ